VYNIVFLMLSIRCSEHVEDKKGFNWFVRNVVTLLLCNATYKEVNTV